MMLLPLLHDDASGPPTCCNMTLTYGENQSSVYFVFRTKSLSKTPADRLRKGLLSSEGLLLYECD